MRHDAFWLKSFRGNVIIVLIRCFGGCIPKMVRSSPHSCESSSIAARHIKHVLSAGEGMSGASQKGAKKRRGDPRLRERREVSSRSTSHASPSNGHALLAGGDASSGTSKKAKKKKEKKPKAVKEESKSERDDAEVIETEFDMRTPEGRRKKEAADLEELHHHVRVLTPSLPIFILVDTCAFILISDLFHAIAFFYFYSL